MVFLLAMVGFAIDIAYQMAAIGELERSMEAAALAGAGKLGFNDTVFPTARQLAQQYAAAESAPEPPFGSLINLEPEHRNAAERQHRARHLGRRRVQPLARRAPSSTRSAASSRRTIQTSFLRLLGIQTLPISASGDRDSRTRRPTLRRQTCMFPIGLS